MAELIALPRRASLAKAEYNGLESSVLDALPHAVITTDLDGRIRFWNKAAEQLYGWRSEEVLGRNILEVTPTADSAPEAAAILATLKLGKRWEGAFQVRHKDGHWFEAKVIDSPVYDANGTLIGIMGVSQPATTTVSTRAIRLIASSFSVVRETFGFKRGQAVIKWDMVGVGIFLLALALLGRLFLDRIVPDRLPFVTFYPATVLAAFFCGPAIGSIVLILSAAAGTWWVTPPPESDDMAFRLSSAIVFVITSGLSMVLILYLRALQACLGDRDRQLALVNRELKHRLQNALTIASSISAQTVQSGIGREELAKAITSRIHAIAAAQDLLDTDPSKGVELKLLVDRLVVPMSPDSSRLTISGDPVLLPGNVATSFALILHELATNALKYGAWCGGEGIVTAAWGKLSSELDFRWQEYHRRTASFPVKQGYGSVLIKNGLPQAEVSHEIAQNGVNCRIQMTL